MTKSEAKELQRLCEENTCLKRFLVQAELEKAAWKELSEGYWQRLACQIVGLYRSAYPRAQARESQSDKYVDLRAWLHE